MTQIGNIDSIEIAKREALSTNDRPSNLTSRGRQNPPKGSSEVVDSYNTLASLRVVAGLIASEVASIEWIAKKPDREGLIAQRRFWDCEVRTHKQRVQSLENSVLNPLIEAWMFGNTILDGFACREVAQTWLDLAGEAFFRYQFGSLGQPIAIWPLVPSWVKDVPNEPGEAYTVRVGNNRPQQIPAAEIFHVKTANPSNPYGRGSGLGLSLSDELDTDEYMSAYIRAFFVNNATPDGFISIEGASQGELERIAQDISNKHRGANNAHQLHFWDGDVKATMLGSSLADMDFGPLRSDVKAYIREIFGVPPECVGVVENSNRATSEAASYIKAINVIVPRAERWRRALQAESIRFGSTDVITYDYEIPGDKEHELAVAALVPWSRTRAEWREAQGLPFDGRVDNVYIVQQGLIEVPVGQPFPEPSGGLGFLSSKDLGGPKKLAKPLIDRADELISKYERQSFFSAADVDTIVNNLPEGELGSTLSAWWGEEMDAFASRVGNARYGLELAPIGRDPTTASHIANLAGDRMGAVDSHTQELVRTNLLKSLEEGEGVAKAQKRLSDALDVSAGRAQRIVRTEITRSAGFASFVQNKQTPFVSQHSWVANVGARDTHAEANGQTVDVGTAFTVGGLPTLYPGATGSASEDINCRCGIIPVVTASYMEDLDRELDLLEAEESVKQLGLIGNAGPGEWSHLGDLRGKRVPKEKSDLSPSDERALEALQKAREAYDRDRGKQTFGSITAAPDILDRRAEITAELESFRRVAAKVPNKEFRQKLQDELQAATRNWTGRATDDIIDVFERTKKSVASALANFAAQKGIK